MPNPMLTWPVNLITMADVTRDSAYVTRNYDYVTHCNDDVNRNNGYVTHNSGYENDCNGNVAAYNADVTEPGAESAIGSNNWAISGAHTASGKPILCNDPHLALNLPSLWYEMQLTGARHQCLRGLAARRAGDCDWL